MFKDLHAAYREMLKKATHIADSDGVHITFPEDLFHRFEKEYNLCFVNPEDDRGFKNWQERGWDDDDKWSIK